MDQPNPPRRPMAPDAFPEILPLIAAATANGIDARAVLARVVTDLFVGRKLHVHAELAQFVALIEPLIRAVDTQTAVCVARKLAAHVETPRAVIESLLAREDEASYETLRIATCLDLRTLDILAEQGSRFVALAIASRPAIGETTARILVARNEAAIDRALARGAEPQLPADVVSRLVARASGNPDLARHVLSLEDLPFLERCSLFLEADPQERAAMASEATRRAFLARARPSPFMREDIDEAVLDLGGAGNARLAEALATWLGLPSGEAQAIVADSTGEALVLALRACGARPGPIAALLLSRGLHLSRSVERIFALDRLARETSGTGAAAILSAFAQTKARPTRHVAQQGAGRDGEKPERQPAAARGELAQAGAFKRRERTR
jgi:uncharacterized protein (DUF2336 family)